MAERPMRLLGIFITLIAAGALVASAPPREPADKGGALTIRVRVVRTVPESPTVLIDWRRGGEGLGGEVVRGRFTGEDDKPEIAAGAWSAPLPLETVVGRARGWEFPTVVVSAPPPAGKKAAAPFTEVAVEFEFAEDGKVFRSFVEKAPKGRTVSFAFPGALLGEKGAADPEFAAQLQGLSGHARARRERLEKAFSGPDPLPKQFAVIGHLAGYGEAADNGKGSAGYGIRHCNPDILADECRTLRLLGVNGLVDSVRLAEAAGRVDDFRRIYWGGPGSGSPMGFLQKGVKDADPCPFDPGLGPHMADSVQKAIEEHKAAGAHESWALWTDEIGVFAKEHIAGCPRCRDAFRAYLRSQGLRPADFGKESWDDVTPYPLWKLAADGKKDKEGLAAAPADGPEALRYYCTFRFMTYATAQVFPESAKKLKEAGILLYAMQGPTPSWTGASLDWHEFYDQRANTALVWETSNRDPRVWQWESYLGDIARGVAARHEMPIGCLVKPHRGAPEQRLLSVVSRGATAVEWYTYGPDYAKGDSFSQKPELLERVARADRFLGRAEDRLYEARWAGKPEAAFVSPRSSEIWGKATDLGVTAFEDAKWVYLALAHAHVPVDVLSEQQLAEGKLGQYKVIYVVGPNLRRDAAAKVTEWVRGGGVLWTDALGLARDEANQPAAASADLLGASDRELETWGSVEGYKAVGLTPLDEPNVPAHAALSWDAGGAWGEGKARAAVGREPLAGKDGEVIARFGDGKRAVVRRRCGKGEVVAVGLWAGLTYSAAVRRADFDMRADFDPALRALVAAPALERDVYRPVAPSEPLVEAVLLEKDGRRSVALINWAYRHAGAAGGAAGELQVAENLRVALPGVGAVKSVRSLVDGDLPIEGEGDKRSVVLPKLEEIDLLILE